LSRVLRVEFGGEIVGRLEEGGDGRLSFIYAAAWLASPSAFAISASLPLQPETFEDRRPQAFFGGLLPEGETRQRLARRLGISEKNDFSLLDKIGGDCAGALSLVGEDEQDFPKSQGREKLDDKALETLIGELPAFPLLTASGSMRRLSLAGAQTKLALVYEQGAYFLPASDEATTHIIKIANKEFDDLVYNELLCMRLAKYAGLNVATVEPDRAGDQRFLRIERYDRHQDVAGRASRVHQEDFCQALGIVAGNKYQVEGGPGFRDCVHLIRELSSYWAIDLEQFLRLMAFNFYIGNCDAHGKNFAFLRNLGHVKLTPAYDLVSTAVYPELSHHMAMKIGGQTDPGLVTKQEWQQLAVELNITEKHLFGDLKNIAFYLEDGLPKVIKDLEEKGWPSPIYPKIRDHVLARIRQQRDAQT